VTGAAVDADAVPFRSTSNTSLQEPHLGRVAARRPSDPDISISLGAHGAIFFSSPPDEVASFQ
jgi:hypothetical protein